MDLVLPCSSEVSEGAGDAAGDAGAGEHDAGSTGGGGINSALEAQRQAIALAPRNVEYQFNLGQIYIAGKKWDLAREVFTRLKAGPDRAAAAAAKQQLEDLETLQKYGLRPQRAGESPETAGAANTPGAGMGAPAVAGGLAQDEDEEADALPKPAPVKPGT